jgi:outer membrane protein TolC
VKQRISTWIRLSRRAVAALALACVGSPEALAQGPAPAPPTTTTLIPPVEDPMLAEPPPAPREIASWDEALQMIREHSPDYLGSAEAVHRAEAQKTIALSAVLPSLAAQASYTHEFLAPSTTVLGIYLPDPATGKTATTPTPKALPSPAPDSGSVGVGAAWPVLSPRGIYGIGTADKGIDFAKLTYEDQRRIIATAVVDAMLATLAGARVAELNRIGLRAALERLTLTRVRLEYGQGTALDVDRALQDAAAARSAVIDGDEALRRTREALGAALGSAAPMAVARDIDLTRFEAAVAATCRLNDDLERRPDVMAARTRVDLAERGVHDAELAFAPSVTLTSQLTYSSAPVLAPNSTWSLGGALVVPIYEGGARYGALRDAKAALEQARQALASARLDAVVSSAQTLRSVSVLDDSRAVARTERDLAARIDQRTRDGYARGLGTSLDLVVSAQDLRQAEIRLALLDFDADRARAHAALINAECVY